MTTDDLAVATTSLAKDVDALADSVQLAVGELRRLRASNAELLAVLREVWLDAQEARFWPRDYSQRVNAVIAKAEAR